MVEELIMKYATRVPLVLRIFAFAMASAVSASGQAYVTVGQAVNVGPPINGPADDLLSDLSDDRLTLIFTRANFDAGPMQQIDGDFWIATRPTMSDAWSEPVALPGPVNSPAFEASPTVTGNGLELFFTDAFAGLDLPMRPGGVGLRDIWVATRSNVDEDFGVPMNLTPTVNSEFEEGGPEISSDGRELYITTRRGDGVTNEIWVTTRNDVTDPLGWGAPVKLGPNVNGISGNAAPSLSADGRTMFFVRVVGSADIWMTTRENASDLHGWSPPVRLGSTVNTPHADYSADISADGSTLLFTSNRPGSDAVDIYQAQLIPLLDPSITVPPAAIYSVIDDDSDAVFDDLGDQAIDASSTPRRAIGEADVATTNRILRLIAKFELPVLLPEPGESLPELKSAKLRFFLEDMDGTPAGPVSVLHNVTDNDVLMRASDYDNADYVDTLLDLVRPDDLGGQYYDLDVTNQVRADYADYNGDRISAFRLQINEAIFLEDDQSGRYRFTMPGAQSNHPELVLTFGDSVLGDVNRDGEVNGLDVDLFVDVLLNGPYQREADMNDDQVVNGLDVDPFVAAVVGGTQQIPEPSTLLLWLFALGVVGGWRKWKHTV
jgi:hypothetical protein